MRFQHLVVVLLLLALIPPIQTALPRPQLKYNHAQLLTADTYQSTLDTNRVVFVVFYSPDCYACLKTGPRFDAVAKYFEKVVGVAVGALNVKEEPEIADREDILKYPTFRLFLGGEAVDYNGNGDSEAMIQFVTEFQMARLLVIPKVGDAKAPAVVVTGISANSNLHSLPALFSRYPVYYSVKEKQFSVQIIGKSVTSYPGDTTTATKGKLVAVAEWLQEQTAPVLVNLGSAKVPIKLQNAIKKELPILALFNKGNQGAVTPQLNVLEELCRPVKDYVCGYVNKGDEDYEHLLEWIADPEPVGNRVAWMDMKQRKCFLFTGQLEQLATETLKDFVEAVRGKTSSSLFEVSRTGETPSIEKQEEL